MLIFVSGLGEIEELSEALADSPQYQFVAIHSELPFEEQLQAFAAPDEEALDEGDRGDERGGVVGDAPGRLARRLPGRTEGGCLRRARHHAADEDVDLEGVGDFSRAGRTARVAPGVVDASTPRKRSINCPTTTRPRSRGSRWRTRLLNLRAMLPEEEGLGDLLDEARGRRRRRSSARCSR